VLGTSPTLASPRRYRPPTVVPPLECTPTPAAPTHQPGLLELAQRAGDLRDQEEATTREVDGGEAAVRRMQLAEHKLGGPARR
jgi:hypothetical protein